MCFRCHHLNIAFIFISSERKRNISLQGNHYQWDLFINVIVITVAVADFPLLLPKLTKTLIRFINIVRHFPIAWQTSKRIMEAPVSKWYPRVLRINLSLLFSLKMFGQQRSNSFSLDIL